VPRRVIDGREAEPIPRLEPPCTSARWRVPQSTLGSAADPQRREVAIPLERSVSLTEP